MAVASTAVRGDKAVGGKVGRIAPELIAVSVLIWCGPRREGPRAGMLARCFARRLGLHAVLGVETGSWRNGAFGVQMAVATRLETRTKESNMCASLWVANPQGAMKVKVG